MPTYDGSVIIKTEIDDKDAQKRLRQLEKDINKLQADINKGNIRRSAIAEQLQQAREKAQEAREAVEELHAVQRANQAERKAAGWDSLSKEELAAYKQSQAEVTGQLREQKAILSKQEASIEKLEAEDRTRAQEIAIATEQLQAQEMEVERINVDLTRQSMKAWPKVRAAADQASAGFSKGLKSLVRYGLGMRSLFVLYRKLRSVLVEGIKEYAKYDQTTANSINGLKSALSGLKGSFVSAFAPIVNAVIPILTQFIGWVTSAANAVSMFFAILGGKSTYKKAVSGLNSVAGAAGSIGDAAKEAKRQLSGLDEMNVWDSESSSSSGAGGGGSSGGGDLAWEDVPVNVDSFTGRLALSFKDVFLDWTDLTGEQIAEKIIAGLLGVMAGVTGFTLTGSLAGGLVGTILGMVLGTVIDTMIFDHDGTISEEEVLRMLALAATALVGGLIGFSVSGGNITGALVGATIGAALYAGISAVFGEEGVLSEDQARTLIIDALGAIMGGIIGWSFTKGNYTGALIGAGIGLALAGAITAKLLPEGELSENETLEMIKKAFTAIFAGKILFNLVGKQIVGTLAAGFGLATLTLYLPAIVEWVEGDAESAKGYTETVNGMIQHIIDSFVYERPEGTNLFDWLLELLKQDFEQMGESFLNWLNESRFGKEMAWIFSADNTVDFWKRLLGFDSPPDSFGSSDDGMERAPYTGDNNANWLSGIQESITNWAANYRLQLQGIAYIDEVTPPKETPTITTNAEIEKTTPSAKMRKPSVDVDGQVISAEVIYGGNTGKAIPQSGVEINAQGNVIKATTTNLPAAQKSIPGMVADITKRNVAEAVKASIAVTANMTKRTVSDKVKDVIALTANFTKRVVQQKVKDQVPMSAKFTSRTLGTNVTKPITSTAYITKKSFLSSLLKPGTTDTLQLNANAKIVSTSGSGTLTLQTMAQGGVYSGGRWREIAQYASGVSRAAMGQLFIAREAGPELVGTLKGHTAVMNNDQIVASVSAGVARAISNIRFAVTGLPAYPAVTADMVPAVALGEVIPPRLLEVREDLDGIRSMLERIAARLDNGGGGNTYNVTATANGRSLFDLVLQEGQNRAAITGRNPFFLNLGGA